MCLQTFSCEIKYFATSFQENQTDMQTGKGLQMFKRKVIFQNEYNRNIVNIKCPEYYSRIHFAHHTVSHDLFHYDILNKLVVGCYCKLLKISN